MKRSPIERGNSELKRTELRRSGNLRARRPTPRRREAVRWTAEEWTEANLVLIARSGSVCECCGTPLNGRAERHHRQRRRDGGDTLENLMLLLPEHHAKVTVSPSWAKSRGLIVPPWDDPAEVPVLWCGSRWVLLGPEGELVPTEALGE